MEEFGWHPPSEAGQQLWHMSRLAAVHLSTDTRNGAVESSLCIWLFTQASKETAISRAGRGKG